MSRNLVWAFVALLFGTIATTSVAEASFSLKVDPLSPISFGRIILASNQTTTISLNGASHAVSVTAPAIQPPSGVSSITVPVTIRCTDTGGNGCKNGTQTVSITGVRTGGRQMSVASFNIGNRTATSGVTFGSTVTGATTTFTVNANNNQSWVVNFDLGMTVNVTPASSSAAATQWTVTVGVT